MSVQYLSCALGYRSLQPSSILTAQHSTSDSLQTTARSYAGEHNMTVRVHDPVGADLQACITFNDLMNQPQQDGFPLPGGSKGDGEPTVFCSVVAPRTFTQQSCPSHDFDTSMTMKQPHREDNSLQHTCMFTHTFKQCSVVAVLILSLRACD